MILEQESVRRSIIGAGGTAGAGRGMHVDERRHDLREERVGRIEPEVVSAVRPERIVFGHLTQGLVELIGL